MSIILLYCLFLNLGIYGQTTESFEKFNIRNTSGQVLSAITEEFRNGNNASQFKSLVSSRKEAYLPDGKAIENYLFEMNEIIGRTRNKQEAQLFLTKSKAELLKYSSDVVMNFADVVPDSLKKIKRFNAIANFATPAIERAVELTANTWVDEKIQADRKNMDEIILSRITLLYTKNKELDLTTATNEKSFEAMFALSQSDIPALNRDDHAVFTKEMVKYAFGFIKGIKSELVEIRQQINNRTPEENEARFNEVKSDYTTRISETEQRITKQVTDDFAQVGEAIENLSNNQAKIKTQLDDFQKTVNENEKTLKQQAKGIDGLKKRISELERNTKDNLTDINENLNQLNKIQNDHSERIAENSFKIDVLTKYTYLGLKPKVQLKGLEDGDFDNIFSPQKKEELKTELNKIILVEGIVDVSNDIAKYGPVTYNFLVEKNILKGEDAKKAGKFLHYLISTTQIVSGAARMYGGDMTGAFSVIQGLGGLFGGQKKPQPSPEMQMLKAIYNKLEKIHEDIIKIQNDISQFRNDVIEMYKSLSNSLQVIADKIDFLNWQADVLRQATSELLFQNYSACESDYRIKFDFKKNKPIISINKYSDYDTFYRTGTGICLKALQEISNSSEGTYFYLSAVSSDGDPNNFRNREIFEVYNPTRDLFKRIYPVPVSQTDETRFNNRLVAIMFPVAKTTATSEPFLRINNLTEPPPKLGDRFLNNYLNYEMVLQFSLFFMIYSPYLEINWSDENFRPQPLEQYLQRTSKQSQVSKKDQSERIEKLIKLTEASIRQQSLLSGNGLLDNVHAILFDSNSKREDILAVNKVLSNNKLLAYNFATYWLHKNLSSNKENYKTFIPLLEEVRVSQTVSQEQLDKLNKFLIQNTSSTKFAFKFRTDDRKLYLTYTKEGEAVDILVPESSVIVENRMINPESIQRLIDMRETLSEKLLDQNFTDNIPTVYTYNNDNNQKVEGSGEDYFKYIFANSGYELLIQ